MKPKKPNWKTAADMKRSEETWYNERRVNHIIQQTKETICNDIRQWCYKNNTIPMLNGGWVNVLKLEAFMAKLLEEK